MAQRRERVTLGSVVAEYEGKGLSMYAAGLGDITFDQFAVAVRTLHALDQEVELADCEMGLQLFDPKRSTPVGWIKPNPRKQD